MIVMNHEELEIWNLAQTAKDIGTLLSISGCVCVFWFIMVNRRRFDDCSYDLELHISLSSFISSLGHLMSQQSVPFTCIVSGFLQTFGGLSLILFILFAVILLWSSQLRYSFSDIFQSSPQSVEPFIYRSIYIFTFLCAMIPVVTGEYSPLYVWCWISQGMLCYKVR